MNGKVEENTIHGLKPVQSPIQNYGNCISKFLIVYKSRLRTLEQTKNSSQVQEWTNPG